MPIIMDANVLIDYVQADPSILGMYGLRIERVVVPASVLAEVRQLSVADCERHGLQVFDEPLDILLAAGEASGPLSFADHVCLLAAKRLELVCVTNEKPLHKACRAAGVDTKWGLTLLLELVDAGQLAKPVALEIVERIHVSNPMFIHHGIVSDFRAKLARL